ncbi:MAG: hypothetical protein OEV42_06450 [Deltaproteobacteria bacterium]|nr:hypothetical protein [Deltaproteobacteria bacterium]
MKGLFPSFGRHQCLLPVYADFDEKAIDMHGIQVMLDKLFHIPLKQIIKFYQVRIALSMPKALNGLTD